MREMKGIEIEGNGGKKKKMKRIDWEVVFKAFILIGGAAFFLYIFMQSITHKDPKYTGVVTETFRTDKPYVVFYCPRVGRKIVVQPKWNTYANVKVGDTISFRLTPGEVKLK